MSAPVTQLSIDERGVREATFSVRRAVNHTLQHCGRALPHHVVGDNAARRSIYGRDDVGLRFFEPTKVNNSSSSTTSGAASAGSEAGNEAW